MDVKWCPILYSIKGIISRLRITTAVSLIDWPLYVDPNVKLDIKQEEPSAKGLHGYHGVMTITNCAQ